MSKFNTLSFIKLCLICSLIAYFFCTCCNAQIKSVGCTGDDDQEFCQNSGNIFFMGNNFSKLTEKQTFNISDDPLITMLVESSSTTSLLGSIYYDAKTVPDGPYSINPHLYTNNATDWNGTLLLGKFWGKNINQAYSHAIPTDAYVTGRASNEMYNGFTFQILGKFNPKKKYSVWFYWSTEHIYLLDSPTCENVTTSATSLTCTVAKISSLGKEFRFMVEEADTHNYLTVKNMIDPVTAVDVPVTHEPTPESLPIITNANSMCVLVSAACVDDAIITFYGLQFTANAEEEYKVNIEGLNDAGCKVYETTNTSLMCKLFGVSGEKGIYDMTMQTKLADGTWGSTKRGAGTISLGQGKNVGGWNINYIAPTNNIIQITESATVTTALTIVFAILFAIVLIVLLVIFFRFKLINRKTWSTVKKQLQDTQVEELRPRAAVCVKSEAAN